MSGVWKIDTQIMKTYTGKEGVSLHDLDHQKLDFLTEKDDLVLNTCQKLFNPNENVFHVYPSVISHLGKYSHTRECTTCGDTTFGRR